MNEPWTNQPWTNEPWPTTEVDPVRRLRALAAGVRGAHVTEAYVDAPFARVWDLLGDLEDAFGHVVTDMERLRVVHRAGERVEAVARSRYGMRARLRGTHRPGWCWLQSRFLLVGVAATPEGPGTRVAFTGGVRLPARAALIPLGVRREGRRNVQRLTALL
ncbi:hypothetical protein [Streptomyces sp. NPDC048172]|uniref:hypothetical protein n=1 Tax=Streptomyces sp. NPDC048172 TaxID=3365505 RepID=UPI0037191BC3